MYYWKRKLFGSLFISSSRALFAASLSVDNSCFLIYVVQEAIALRFAMLLGLTKYLLSSWFASSVAVFAMLSRDALPDMFISNILAIDDNLSFICCSVLVSPGLINMACILFIKNLPCNAFWICVFCSGVGTIFPSLLLSLVILMLMLIVVVSTDVSLLTSANNAANSGSCPVGLMSVLLSMFIVCEIFPLLIALAIIFSSSISVISLLATAKVCLEDIVFWLSAVATNREAHWLLTMCVSPFLVIV